MKVIMKKTGKIKEVADGYARNFLIPQGLAEPATNSAVAADTADRKAQDAQRKKAEQEWDAYLQKLESLTVEVTATVNDQGALFGALPISAIIDGLAREQVAIEEGWIQLAEPIKHTGDVQVGISFPNGKKAQFTLRVSQ